jgi:drug/metabolite transporter (DMT)-like permease
MSVPLSYIAVIMIWATTPLAIKWSSQGASFIFAVSSRMILGAILALAITAMIRKQLPWDRRSVLAYLYSGLGFSVAMICVYWGAQFIPSGWVSLLFGTSPLVTGVLVYVLSGNNELSNEKTIGLLLALAGLSVIFITGFTVDGMAVAGILAVLLSTVIYSYTALKVKQHNNGLPAMTINTGGLLVAVPLYGLSWLLIDGQVPDELPLQAGLSILYLAIFGTLVGFALFFYILKNVSVTRVSLITLITPVAALVLGNYLNGEPVTLQVVLGAMMILTGLAAYEFGHLLKRRRVYQQ